mgnify:CR=1 FL=1
MWVLVYELDTKVAKIAGELPADAGIFAPDGILTQVFENKEDMLLFVKQNQIIITDGTDA